MVPPHISGLGFDRDGLAQVAGIPVVNQYLIVIRYNRVPAISLCEGGGGAAVRQGDRIGQFHAERVRELGDKEHHDHYEAQNHRNGQGRDQNSQIFHQRRIDRLRFRAIFHGLHTANRSDRCRSACAP